MQFISYDSSLSVAHFNHTVHRGNFIAARSLNSQIITLTSFMKPPSQSPDMKISNLPSHYITTPMECNIYWITVRSRLRGGVDSDFDIRSITYRDSRVLDHYTTGLCCFLKDIGDRKYGRVNYISLFHNIGH